MNGVVRLLLPLRCLGCGVHVPEGGDGGETEPMCLDCRLKIRRPPFPRCPRCDLPRGTGSNRPARCGRCDEWPDLLVRALAAAVLEPPADVLVQALKYGGWSVAARIMGRAMAARLRAAGVPPAARLVPIPTTPRRLRRRGYNQAHRLAVAVGDVLGLEVVELLARHPTSSSQVALQVDQRRANVSGAFLPGPGARPINAHFHMILVDDVLTTGATACAAAEALSALGATRVSLLAFARALPRSVGGSVVDGSSSSIRT